MKILLSSLIKNITLSCLIICIGFFGLKANDANISCGNPTKTGSVTVHIVVENATGGTEVISWNASIDKTDDANQKANKIRAAAPPNDPRASIGGTANAVTASSGTGFTIKKMYFKHDSTNESEVHNVFTVSVADNMGGVALDGLTSGFDDDGLPGFVTVGTGEFTAFIPTVPGQPADIIENQIVFLLQQQGALATFIDPGNPMLFLIDQTNESGIILLPEIEPATGLFIDVRDTGLELETGGLFDSAILNPPPASVFFQGLNNTGIGQGQASLSPDGNLVVSNIGSSGLDGVSIDLGESRGVEVQLDAGHPEFLLLQTLTLEATGSMGGIPGQNLGTLTVSNTGAGHDVTADYSAGGTTSMRLEVVNDGEIVYVVEGFTDPVVANTPEQPHRCGKRIRPGTGLGPNWPPALLCYYIGPDHGNPVPWDIPGHGTYFGDELRVLAENGNATVDYISNFSLQFVGPAVMAIADLFLDMFQQFHQGLGASQLNASGGNLTVSNIGSSGLDGVSIDLGEDTKAFGMEWLPLPPPLPGGNIHIESSGSCGGTTQPLGWVDITENGGQYEVYADYSIGGTTTMLLEVYLNGEIIDYIPMQPNDPGTPRVITGDPPGGCGKGIPRGGLYCYRIPYPAPTACSITGYGTIMADEIRILAENGSCTIDHISLFEVTFSGYADPTIINESITASAETQFSDFLECLADCEVIEDHSDRTDCIIACLEAYKAALALSSTQQARFDPSMGVNGTSEFLIIPEGGTVQPRANLYDFNADIYLPQPNGITSAQFSYSYFDPGSEPFLPLPWIPLGPGTFDGVDWVAPTLPLFPQDSNFILRAELLGHPLLGPVEGFTVVQADNGCGENDLTPPLFVDSFFDVEYTINPYIGMHWVGDHQTLNVFDAFGSPISLNLSLASIADVVPDPRKNGSYWVADSAKVRCFNSKGVQQGSDIPTTGKGEIVPDPRNNGAFWVADSTQVRCYNQNGQSTGTTTTAGKGEVVPDPRNNGAFWVADTVKVRCYNQNGQQVGSDINTTGKGDIVPDPRNNGAFWVADSTQVRCYNQNGQLTGTIITNTKSTIVPDPRNNGAFWVVDTNRIRCYDQNGRLRTTVTTTGKADLVPDPRGNGSFWVADDTSVRCFNRRGRQIGGTITTAGKACIIPDPRGNGGFWIADNNGVRCFNSRGQQIGSTITTAGKAKIVPDPRNNGSFWTADSTRVRCYNSNGQQVGGDITTAGKADIVPDPRKNGAFWTADSTRVRCYNQNGQQVGSDITTNGKGDIVPDPRRNGGFWVADDDNVRCYDQNGTQIASVAMASRGRITAFEDPYQIPVPGITDNCSGSRLSNDYTFLANASDYYPVGITPVIYTATDANGNSASVNMNVTIIDQFRIDPQVMLQGPFDPNTNSMFGFLYQQELLPDNEPFTGFGFNPINPDETAPILLDPPFPSLPAEDRPVDWIYVRVFDAPTVTSTEYTSKAGLLYGDGSIKNPDGSPFTLEFPSGVERPDQAYFNFQGRNHLDAWTMDPVDLLTIGGSLDMTDPTVPFPTDAIQELGPGVMGIVSGDTNFDRVIDSADRAGTWNFRNAVGYLPWDINFDGVTDSADRAGTWNNRNLSSQ